MKTNRNILRILFATALAALTVSCSKDGADPVNKGTTGNTPGGGSTDPYSFLISAGREQSPGEENAGTRATLDLGTLEYLWDANDQVVMSVTPANSPTPVTGFSRFTMTSTNTTGGVEHTNFRAGLSIDQFAALREAGSTFDYYSYFPANINGLASTAPNILQFTVPSTFSSTAGAFPYTYAPMAAWVPGETAGIINDSDLTGLAESVGGIHMPYKHVMSYAAIEMDVRLLPGDVRVNSITMTSTDASQQLWGTYTYNMFTGTGSYANGSNSITINIPGGLLVGDGSVFYIPMPPGLSVPSFKFEFTTNSETQTYEDISTADARFTIPGVTFERSKIHKIRLAPSAGYTTAANPQGVQFQITQDGLYFIEAYGGNGGHIEEGGSGKSYRIAGLYRFAAGEWITMYIGKAGQNSTGWGQGSDVPVAAQGGTNGSAYGTGGNGARGGSGDTSYSSRQPGEGGAGGGAATFVFKTATQPGSNPSFNLPGDIVIVSGGGGGSGGGSRGYSGTRNPAKGGDGAEVDDNDPNNSGYGTNGTTMTGGSVNGGGGGGDGTAGIRGTGSNGNGTAGNPGNADFGAGGTGGTGQNHAAGWGALGSYSAGGGGGGGGGGYRTGGGGGGGGSRRDGIAIGTVPGAGGGGGGGQSFRQGNIHSSDSGYPANFTPPEHERVDPSSAEQGYIPINGYVYITFVRQ